MLKKIMVLTVTLSFSTVAFGFGSSAQSPLLYYEMGGGEPIREPLTTISLPSIGINAGFKTVSACDLWDIKHLDDIVGSYGDMVVKHLDGQIDQLGQQILVNITAMAQGLIAAAVQRAMPGMYDYSQNVHAQLSGKIEVAKKSCESVLESTNGGGSPFADWKSASNTQAWADALGVSVAGTATIAAQGNILNAQDEVARNNAKTSITWFGGRKGGEGEDPIVLVKDTVQAGYALQAGSAATDSETTAAGDTVYKQADGGDLTRPTRLGKIWTNSGEAVDWATKVLGEKEVSYCPTCDAARFQGGTGVLAAYYDERELYAAKWVKIFENGVVPTIAEMENVSAGSVHLTKHVYEALEDMIPQDRKVYVDRLVADVAINATAEKAMALRSILRSAASTPEVLAYPHVKEELEALQDDLKNELNELKWELDLKKSLSSDTASTLVAYHNASKSRSKYVPVNLSVPTEKEVILAPDAPKARD